ncbi:MAG TPA: response regulator transcription factor [Gaiellaceae bacterium]|jgi:DNA-binding response OmpR family regulator
MSGSRILVVDDDDDIRGLVRTLLERAGHQVSEASDGRAGLRELYTASPDLVVLDVTMPGLDGWATLERIREVTDVPVLMLTARDTEVERVRGLTGGADDYVVKPFGRQELVARVEALLRRSRGGSDQQETYADALLSISFTQQTVRYDEREVALTPLEYRLLSAFVRHPNQVLSHDQLRELVWGDSLDTSRDEVKLYVGYLRRKLSPDAPRGTPIETVRGFGYRYRPPG